MVLVLEMKLPQTGFKPETHESEAECLLRLSQCYLNLDPTSSTYQYFMEELTV